MNNLLSHPLGYKPYKYQKTGIENGVKMRKFINGDDMGLGKTLQTITLLQKTIEERQNVLSDSEQSGNNQESRKSPA